MKKTQTVITKYSDHKAFNITIGINTNIIPIKGNIRKIIDIQDRNRKNLILIEWLTHMKQEDRPIDIINLYNSHLQPQEINIQRKKIKSLIINQHKQLIKKLPDLQTPLNLK